MRRRRREWNEDHPSNHEIRRIVGFLGLNKLLRRAYDDRNGERNYRTDRNEHCAADDKYYKCLESA